MNREILFRGKRLQGGSWVEGYFYKSDINKRERESGKATLIFTPDCDTFIYIPEAHNSVMVIAETVGQYTGLTDKNGTKIFEGDILQGDEYPYCSDGKFNYYAEVVFFDDGCFADCELIEDFISDNWLVIGNIYDNAELLED